MNRIRTGYIVFSFLVISLGLTFFLCLYYNASSFTILEHSFHPSLLFIFLFTGIIFFLLLSIWRLMATAEQKHFNKDLSKFLWEGHLAYLPFAFSLLSPLLIKHYITSSDLKIRLNIFAVAMVLGFLYLKFLQYKRNLKGMIFFEKSISRFDALSLRKRILILFVAAFLIYNLCTFFLVSKGITFSGDEPYYLLTTHSLYEDKDINVANNYINKDYFHFYSKEQNPDLRLGVYARFGKKGEQYVYPISMPGVSVLMLPYYWLSQFFKGKTLIFILKGSLSIWAVLLGIQLYLLSMELLKKNRLAFILWLFYSFSVPLLFYAVHLYPEVPIAFFSILIFRKVRSKNSLSLFQYFFLGFLLSLFLWFGLKYNMIFWPLLIVSIYFLLKEHKARWKIICFLAFPLISFGLFYLYLYELYGSLIPFSIYEGVMTPEKMHEFKETALRLPLLSRIDSFFDYFLDQRDGLLLYSPFYFFAFLGLFEAFRRNKKDLIAMLFISLPFVLNYAFFTHRQGYCPQGRVLTSISWVGAVLIGYFLAYNRKKLYSALFRIMSIIGLLIAIVLIEHPYFLYQPTTHQFTFRGGELFIFLSNPYFYLPNFLPSFIKGNNVGYIPNYIWLCLIGLFITGYLLKKERMQHANFSVHVLFTMVVLFIIFVGFSFYPRLTLISPTNTTYPTGEKISFYSLSRNARMAEAGEFNLFQDDRCYNFHFTSWYKIKKFKIEFGSSEGSYKVEMRLFDKIIFKGKTSKEILTRFYASPPFYRLKKKKLYNLRIDIKNISDVFTAEKPYFLSIQPSY